MTPVEKAHAVAEAQDLLGVATYATEVELHKAWRKLAFELHPDRGAGSNHEMANVNAAYNFLRTRSRQHYPNAAPVKAPTPKKPPKKPMSSGIAPKRVRPRPVVSTKIKPLSELVEARCRKALKPGSATQADHVPASIRRCGREIEYLVSTPLAKGVNRMALPIFDSVSPHESRIRTITFSASESGCGTFTIPEHLRRDIFAGARDVRIHFAKSGI